MFGEEIEFRTKLEVALMNKSHFKNNRISKLTFKNDSGLYVVSGGPNTLLTICQALYESINVIVFHVRTAHLNE